MLAVILNKKIVFSFLFLSQALLAIEAPMLLAKLRYEQSLKEYNNKISICSKGEETPLTIDSLRPLKLTKKEWGTVLFYTRNKAYEECIFNEKNAFIIAVGTYLAVAKHYKFDVSDTSHYKSSNLFSYEYKTLEDEVDYLQINSMKRQYIEKLEVLKRPFSTIKTFDLIEKSDLLIK